MVGSNLSHRCRTEDALAAVEQAVLERLPEGSRAADLTLTTHNGTQFTSSRFLETLRRLDITHRRTAYHHPEATCDRFMPLSLNIRPVEIGGFSCCFAGLFSTGES